MTRQDVFLVVATTILMLGLAVLTVAGVTQYQQDRARFQDSQQVHHHD